MSQQTTAEMRWRRGFVNPAALKEVELTTGQGLWALPGTLALPADDIGSDGYAGAWLSASGSR
tara:strand:- start:1516 stop:1704 length:189 start_codon:yes stop_codon:yes gene_type:complete